jgi:hypothetical protein
MLTEHFIPAELAQLKEGIRRYIRLMGLIYDPNPLVWNKWFTDEGDVKAALRSVADAMKGTEPMIGKRKYQGVDYNAPREVNKLLTTYLTSGKDSSESALLKKRNLPMFLLVIEPTIALFYKFDHPTMIANADAVVEDVCNLVDQCTDYGTYDDALVAQHQVYALIHEREAERKAIAAAKSRRKKSRDPVAELMASLGLNTEDDQQDEHDELTYA